MAEKATNEAKCGGVISNGEDKWFFLHSTNLCNLLGLGLMITIDMLPFLYQKWRQLKTIEKLQAARKQAQLTTTTPSKTTPAKMDIDQEEDALTNDGNP